jgi:predicted DNA-binding transcriptional regulator AlpA
MPRNMPFRLELYEVFEYICDMAKTVRKGVKKTRKAVKKIATKKVKKTAEKVSRGELLESMDQYPELMKPSEVQEVLRVSKATIFRMLDAGALPGAVRVHGSWRCIRDVLRQWLIDQANGGVK